MHHRHSASLVVALLLGFAPACVAPPAAVEASADQLPNIIIFFADDLGYGDLSCYGATGFSTPNLDRLATEGMLFTDFYVCTAVCTPSRAGLLTGRYPQRYGLGLRVLFPFSKGGLPAQEQTLAEVLSARGYRTACIGKWHLGHRPEFLPTRQGFDEFYGVPYSNDMDSYFYRHNGFQSPPLPVFRGEEIVESGPDQRFLTRRWTESAVRFLRANRQRPFFLYLAHNMPHQPIHASPGYRGSSTLGLYGDVIQELDGSMGRILDELDRLGLAENTLVLFTSDNGPWRQASAKPLRGKKNTTWEGGHRVPCLVRWPERIAAGQVIQRWASTLDLLPTFAALADAPLPHAPLDGQDLSTWFSSAPAFDGGIDPQRVFYYYRDNRLQALRSGRWKLHLYRPEWPKDQSHSPLLYDLRKDPAETHDLAAQHPEVVQSILALAQAARAELGDALHPDS